MIRAAGILFADKDNRVLLLRRTGDDHSGEWALPGGHVEEDEKPEAAALREAEEETGYRYDGELESWMRRIKDGVDFTIYIARPDKPFDVKLNGEHDMAKWVPYRDALEMRLHPGARVALERAGWDELDLAQAMARDDIVSPQHCVNMLLVKLRVTGTGEAFRPKYDEHVWREPAFYMNQRFLQRCYGLPVIWKHPNNKKEMLDSQQFSARIVGTIYLPYLVPGKAPESQSEGGEVWAIAKIWDDEAMDFIEKHPMSTSPCVIFGKDGPGERLPYKDGSHILVENPPGFMDHLALLPSREEDVDEPLGVWDKGHAPDGVESVTADSVDALDRAINLLREYEFQSLLRRLGA